MIQVKTISGNFIIGDALLIQASAEYVLSETRIHFPGVTFDRVVNEKTGREYDVDEPIYSGTVVQVLQEQPADA